MSEQDWAGNQLRRDEFMRMVDAEFRPLYDELEQRALEAERIAMEKIEEARNLERLAWHRIPVVRNLDGWRWAIILGPVVIGLRRR